MFWLIKIFLTLAVCDFPISRKIKELLCINELAILAICLYDSSPSQPPTKAILGSNSLTFFSQWLYWLNDNMVGLIQQDQT